MKLKAIIFDMDGVLIDSIKFHIHAWREAFAKEGINLTTEQVGINEGASTSETMIIIERDHGHRISEGMAQRVTHLKNQLFDEIYKRQVYSGVVEFLEYAKSKNLKLAVVTGSNRKLAEKNINEEFPNIFDFIISSSDVARGKPYPEPYLKAVNILDLKKEECVVIENAPLGIQSAKSAGLRVYALETTLDKKHLLKADIVFKNHEELFKHLKSELN